MVGDRGAAEPTPELQETLRRAAEEIAAGATGRVKFSEPLAPFTSFRVGGPAGVLVEPKNETDLEVTGSVVSRLGLDVLVLGRGTNVLIGDEGFPGVVIRMGKGFEWIRAAGEHGVEAGGGANLPQVANWAKRRGLSGMEFATAIPATVGGGVAMNAGAHGSSLSEVLESARVCHLAEGRTEELSMEDLQMSYRKTSVGPGSLVCSARFRLAPGDPAEIASRMERYRGHRTETQPSEAPNAGSTFRNPPGHSAGGLIEAAGLKGFRIGGAEVSSKHANFFFARPGARAQDVFDLMVHVQAEVEQAAGVTLVPEVRIIGFFDHADALKTR
ncbi:MAG TPA: UDP-N-acetylmuramate dehydrogenase [Actinomycetota bacterium]|nr:UDP-N-acetylmuramate dehydrogenase [Actinomycetota bacterium]